MGSGILSTKPESVKSEESKSVSSFFNEFINNTIKSNERQRNKIKELRKKLLKSINLVKTIRSSKIKSSEFDKLKEKYKEAKKRLKVLKNSGKSSNNENHLHEVSKLEELNKVKDMKIMELQSEIQKRDMSISELLKSLDK